MFFFCQQETLYVTFNGNMKVVSLKLPINSNRPILNKIENMIKSITVKYVTLSMNL